MIRQWNRFAEGSSLLSSIQQRDTRQCHLRTELFAGRICAAARYRGAGLSPVLSLRPNFWMICNCLVLANDELRGIFNLGLGKVAGSRSRLKLGWPWCPAIYSKSGSSPFRNHTKASRYMVSALVRGLPD